MKDNFTWIALCSAVSGWLVTIATYKILSIYSLNHGENFDVLIFAAFTLPVVVLANLLFIQLPSKYVKEAFLKLSAVPFVLAATIYALVITTVVFNSLVLRDIEREGFICSPLLLTATINGFAFGLVFRFLWKPHQTDD